MTSFFSEGDVIVLVTHGVQRNALHTGCAVFSKNVTVSGGPATILNVGQCLQLAHA